MQELNMMEVDAVSGGIFWLIIIPVVVILSGCSKNEDPLALKKAQHDRECQNGLEPSDGKPCSTN